MANATTTAARLFALIAAAFVCAHATTDPDLWGHLKFGLDTIRDGRLAAVDPYSFNQGVAVLDHEWLGEVVQALAYRAGGVFALLIVKPAVLAAAFALLAVVARRASEPYRWWLLAVGIAGVAPAGYTLRPQLWSLLAVPALWYTLGHRRWLPCVPLIFALWANLHGGWIVGAGVAALWVAGRVIDARSIRAAAPAAVALAIGLAATLVNPYGWKLWQFMLTFRVSRNITEFRPLWQQTEASFAILWALVALGIVVATVVWRRRTITWAGALPVAWLAVMSLFVTRLLPFFSEVAVLGLAETWRRAAPSAGLESQRPKPPAFAIVDVAIVAAVMLANVLPQSRCLVIQGSWAPDLAAAAAFRPVSVQGRLVLPFNWGQYAIWHWGPRVRVSIDGRRETVYTEQMIELQSAVTQGRSEGIEYLARVRPEYVWLPRPDAAPVAAWMQANGYRLDVDTERSVVGVRADLPRLDVGTPMPRCFP